MQVPSNRNVRTIRDINEAKAMRRLEIERRCSSLDPPLLPNILCHIEPFQASLQIATPFTDKAWEVLKPRLLAQRPMGEAKENETHQYATAIEK